MGVLPSEPWGVASSFPCVALEGLVCLIEPNGKEEKG